MIKNKKIVILTDHFYPRAAGVGNASLSLGRALFDMGWNVEVITPRRSKEWLKSEIYYGLHIYRPNFGWWLQLPILKWCYYFLYPLLVFFYIKKTKPFYILGQEAWSNGWIAVIASKLARAKAIVYIHAHPDYLNRILFLAKWAYKEAEVILSTTQDSLKFLKESWGMKGIEKRGFILPNALHPFLDKKINKEEAKEKLAWDKEKFHIINVGRMVLERGVETKGINYMIEAMKDLPDCMLHLVGEGPLKAEYLQQIKRSGLENNVELEGNISHEQVFNFIQAADVLVMSSLHEGLSMLFLEASSLKLPIIATKTAGVRTYFKNNESVLLVPIKDSKAIGEAVNKLKNNLDLRQKIGHNVYNVYLNNFLPQKVAAKFEEILKQYENSFIQTK